MVCPCKFPLIIVKDGIEFISLPLEIFSEDDLVQIPSISEKKDEKGDWIEVKWKDTVHEGVKSYDVAGHIVYAGCDESKLECDIKNIYSVMHPKDEWMNYHIIDMDVTK